MTGKISMNPVIFCRTTERTGTMRNRYRKVKKIFSPASPVNISHRSRQQTPGKQHPLPRNWCSLLPDRLKTAVQEIWMIFFTMKKPKMSA